MRLFRHALTLMLFMGLVTALSSCRPKGEIKVLPSEAPSWRAAASFVHCVEAGRGLCVTRDQMVGGWDAFYILSWLSDGSPVSILEALPRQLRNHEDARLVQARLVEEVERYAQSIRGAECDPVGMLPLDVLIDRTAQRAASRLEELGIWEGGLARVVTGLTAEAHEDLDGGALVRLDCRYDPYMLYVASQKFDGRQTVVGMITLFPPKLGGGVPSREDVDTRLHSRSLGLDTASAPIVEGQIDPWLPFEVEVF